MNLTAHETYVMSHGVVVCTKDAHVDELPDGALLTWFRIEGDETSQAVAILRREGEHAWVSPGGYGPEPLEILTYPLTAFLIDKSEESLALRRIETLEQWEERNSPKLTTAGQSRSDEVNQYARENALVHAVQWANGQRDGTAPEDVVAAARTFEAFLKEAR